jgi:DNA (cytosine-5)-methyltransferase 1
MFFIFLYRQNLTCNQNLFFETFRTVFIRVRFPDGNKKICYYMNLGSLFSGRGGFEIGAKFTGIETSWTCEIDEFLHNKLKRIAPNAEHYRDVKSVKNLPAVDIITAGFPCQDISISNSAGRRGIKGHRSGLWTEVCRITNEVKPRYLVLENSPELLKQGFEYVLADLSSIGYDAEWDCWRAADFGYPHNRRRLYVIAYPVQVGRRQCRHILQPPGAYELSQAWAPTPAYLRWMACRSDGYGNIKFIQRGDVVPNFRREISAFGNSIMPVATEHLFKCILNDCEYDY